MLAAAVFRGSSGTDFEVSWGEATSVFTSVLGTTLLLEDKTESSR
jgi:hypothetical protein